MSFAAIAAVGGSLIGASASRSASSAASDASDRATATAQKSADDRLSFDKQAYADGAGDRQFASDMARRGASWSEQDRTKYNALQDEQVARGRKFQGVEDKMLSDAQTYDTDDRRDKEAGLAMADVNQAFDAVRGQQVRSQQRMGVNPSSGAALSLESTGRMRQALGLAGAAHGARKTVETQGYARKMDAVGLGKGMIGNQGTQAQLQLSAGNSAVANSMVPISVANSANDRMSQGFGANATAGMYMGRMNTDNYFKSQNYGANVGANTGYMIGNLLSKPGVTNGISSYLNTSPGSSLSSEVSGLGSNTWNPMSDFNTGQNGWGNYGE